MKEYTRQQNMNKQKSDIQMAIEEYKEFERVPNTPGYLQRKDSLNSDVLSQVMARKLSQNSLSFKGGDLKNDESLRKLSGNNVVNEKLTSPQKDADNLSDDEQQ